MAKKVYIGVGHGGSDPGAVANGFEEEVVNLAVAKACYSYLKARGVSVKISRTKDVGVWVEERVKQANAFGADLAVDIHHNAGGGDGAEVYHTKNGGTGKTLANNILAELKAIGQNSRGAKTKLNSSGGDYYQFIRETTMPAVLCECAFLDNKKDLKIIDTAAEQKVMGEAVARGILKTLGISDKVVTAETTEKENSASEKSETLYVVQTGAFKVKKNAESLLNKMKKAGFKGFIVKHS